MLEVHLERTSFGTHCIICPMYIAKVNGDHPRGSFWKVLIWIADFDSKWSVDSILGICYLSLDLSQISTLRNSFFENFDMNFFKQLLFVWKNLQAWAFPGRSTSNKYMVLVLSHLCFSSQSFTSENIPTIFCYRLQIHERILCIGNYTIWFGTKKYL